jgi:hypothetical protein
MLRRMGRRLGVGSQPGFDPTAWLPGDVMARFFEKKPETKGDVPPIEAAGRSGKETRNRSGGVLRYIDEILSWNIPLPAPPPAVGQ